MKNSFVREILKAKLPEPGGASTVELAESYLDAPPSDTQLKFRFTRTTWRITEVRDRGVEQLQAGAAG